MKKNVSNKFFDDLRTLAASDGYRKEKDVVFAKEVVPGVKWGMEGHLSSRFTPNTAFLHIWCSYLHASTLMHQFLIDVGIEDFRDQVVGFGSMVERHSTVKTSTHVCPENCGDPAREAYEKFKEAEKIYLEPRIDQSVAVDEYLTKPPYKWPVGALVQCCLTIVSFGLLTKDPKMIRQGIERTFEILDKPNYSQMHRGFFESLRVAVNERY